MTGDHLAIGYKSGTFPVTLLAIFAYFTLKVYTQDRFLKRTLLLKMQDPFTGIYIC